MTGLPSIYSMMALSPVAYYAQFALDVPAALPSPKASSLVANAPPSRSTCSPQMTHVYVVASFGLLIASSSCKVYQRVGQQDDQARRV